MLRPCTDLNSHVTVWGAGANADASGDPKIVTAGATEDGTKVTGETINLGQGLTRPMSGTLCITGVANLAADETLTFAAELEESADGSAWDTAESITLAASGVVLTGATTAGATFDVNAAVKLKDRKQYIRFNITPTMSASGTDTATWAATFVGAGSQDIPTA
jgi:hypothetical protein